MGFLTVSTFALIAYGLVTRRYDRALALAGATSAGAALVVGGVAVPTFYAVTVAFLGVLGAQYIGGRRPRSEVQSVGIPGARLFLAFFVWCVLVTLISPLLFDGLHTVTPDDTVLSAGALTSSNIAQTAYLGLSIFVLLLLAHTRGVGPHTIGLLLLTGVALSLWRYLAIEGGVPFPFGLFDNSPSFAYIETAAGGVTRFRGIYPEPSALAGTTVAAATFAIARASQVAGAARVGLLAAAGVAVFLGVVSTATTFLIVAVIMAGAAGVVLLARFVVGRLRLSAGGAYGVLAAAIGAIWVVPWLYEYLRTVFGEKIGTDSYGERSGADADSYQVFLDTFGFGVGLGNGRASSLGATVLSTTGYVGTALLIAAVTAVVVPALKVRRAMPVLWVLLAALVTSAVSGPDLTPTTGLVWMCLGAIASTVVADRVDRAHGVADRAVHAPR